MHRHRLEYSISILKLAAVQQSWQEMRSIEENWKFIKLILLIGYKCRFRAQEKSETIGAQQQCLYSSHC